MGAETSRDDLRDLDWGTALGRGQVHRHRRGQISPGVVLGNIQNKRRQGGQREISGRPRIVQRLPQGGQHRFSYHTR